MKKQYCEYCGTHVDEGCDCLRELAEMKLQFIVDYENDPMVQFGWAQQDAIDRWRMER